jgi:hypothetical protein
MNRSPLNRAAPFVALAAIWAAIAVPAARADDPDDNGDTDPGYSIDGQPRSPGQETLPKVCLTAPIGCGREHGRASNRGRHITNVMTH